MTGRIGLRCLCVCFAVGAPVALANAQGIDDRDKALFDDGRLNAALKSTPPGHANVEDMLPLLAAGSGLKFSVHPKLAENPPELGDYGSDRSFSVALLMVDIAHKYPKGAYWKKTDAGYELTPGDPLPPGSQPSNAAQSKVDGHDPMREIYADSRLQVKVRLVAKHPNVEDMLTTLASAAKLEFSVHPTLAENQPDFGELYLTSTSVSNVMGFIASKYGEGTYWEKTDDGYTLTTRPLAAENGSGDSSGPDAGAGSSSGRWILWSAMGLLIVGSILVAVSLVRSHRARAAALVSKVVC